MKPTLEDLAAYDIVVWSSPEDSPGQIGVNDVISDYLGLGGRLLISGQNVGSLDGQNETREPWWSQLLQANFVGETAVTGTLQGIAGSAFEGLAFTLNGSSSADNQTRPDSAAPRANSLTTEIVHYADGQPAGLFTGACEKHRVAYFGFGLEGVAQAEMRRALVQRSIDLLLAPPRASGAAWQPATSAEFVLPGTTVTTAVNLQNLGELLTDTFELHVDGRGWTAQILTPTMQLGPCERAATVLAVEIPPTVAADSLHTIHVTAVSQRDPAATVPFSLTLKTPSQLLLVDDDRFFNREQVYTAVLDDLGLDYDVWETGWNGTGRGSPPLELLQAYETVIWFTGYDWLEPVTSRENEHLQAYVAGGGRLFLTSQDYAYHNGSTAFANQYLGLLGHQESITPTQVWEPDSGGHIVKRALPLTFAPYKNFGDGLVVRDGWETVLWHDGGVGGVQYSGDDGRIVYWAVPFETLPPDARAPALQRVLGQLGDLGASTWEVDAQHSLPSDLRSYTLTLRMRAGAARQWVSVENPLPESLKLELDSLSEGMTYDAAAHTVQWQGDVSGGEIVTIRYRAHIEPKGETATEGAPAVVNPVNIIYGRQPFPLQLTATTWLNVPDLTRSAVTSTVTTNGLVQTATYTLTITNSGMHRADPLTATLRFPPGLKLITDSVRTAAEDGRVTLLLNSSQLTLTHDLLPGKSIVAAFGLTRTMTLAEWTSLLIVLDNGVSAPVLIHTATNLSPYRMLLPVVAHR